MKLLLDEMLDPAIAAQLRKHGWDVQAIQDDTSLIGKKDLEILRASGALGRVLVTDNVPDFARLHNRFIAAGENHFGLLFASPASLPRSKRTIGLWVAAIARFLELQNDDKALLNTCAWLK